MFWRGGVGLSLTRRVCLAANSAGRMTRELMVAIIVICLFVLQRQLHSICSINNAEERVWTD